MFRARHFVRKSWRGKLGTCDSAAVGGGIVNKKQKENTVLAFTDFIEITEAFPARAFRSGVGYIPFSFKQPMVPWRCGMCRKGDI